jgi:hypothetical protein
MVMDLLAPNPVIMRTGFVQLGIIIVVLIITMIKRSTSLQPVAIWCKLNAPLVSIICGEIWAMLAYVFFHTGPAIDDYFIVGVWIAGGSGLVASIVKDATDGSMGTATVPGVVKMRQKNAEGRAGGRKIG